jgi:ribonuclease J
MRLDAVRVRNWLDLLKLDLYGMESEDKLHASGHATGKEVRDIIKQIDPKMVIPVHTEKPDHLKQFFENVTVPKERESIIL